MTTQEEGGGLTSTIFEKVKDGALGGPWSPCALDPKYVTTAAHLL